MLKVLVIVYGNLLGNKSCWKSLKKYVLDYYQADLALLSRPLETLEQKTYLGQYAKYHWEIENSTNWNDVFDSAVNHPSDKGKWKELGQHGASFLGSSFGPNDPLSVNSTVNILALRHIALQRIQSLHLDEKYDWFIYTRSDYIYLCSPPHLDALPNRTLSIPRGEANLGYTDRFLIAPANMIARALNITTDIVNNYYEWITLLDADTKTDEGVRKIEWSLKKFFDRTNTAVSLFPHVAFTVRDVNSIGFLEGNHDSILQHYEVRVISPGEKKEAEDQCAYWNVFMIETQHNTPTEMKLLQDNTSDISLPITHNNSISLLDTSHSVVTTSSSSTLRTLVMVYGSLRGGKSAWKSLKRYVLDYYQADLALLSPPFETIEQKIYLGQYAKYIWEIEEYSDWSVVFDSAVNNPSEKGKWKELCKHGAAFLGSVSNCNAYDPLSANSSAAILLAYRHIAVQKIQSLRLVEKYDWFIYTRSDYIYLCSPPHLGSLPNSTLSIPKGEAYFGYTDRFMISPASVIAEALNMTADIVNNYQEWIELLDSDTHSGKGVRMIEWSLKKYLDKKGLWAIPFNHVAFTVRDVKDQTKLSEGHHDAFLQQLGLRVKYPLEKRTAEEQCTVWNIFMNENIPVVPKELKLIQGMGKSIYMVMNRTLHYMNLDVFIHMGFEFTDVEFVPDQVLIQLPYGDTMTCEMSTLCVYR